MNIRALVLGAGIFLGLGLHCRAASTDCVNARVASPIDRHYSLAVDNHCVTPIVLSVCWRWSSAAESDRYRLSRAGNVTFLGPEVLPGQAATATWQRCRAGDCTIACASSTASNPAPGLAPSANAPAAVVSTPPVGSQQPPPPPQWGAMAAGIDAAGSGGTGHVGVGWAIGSEETAAQKAALLQCRNQGISSCKIVNIYNEGCGYITTGNDGKGGYGWGSGATADRAVRNCASQGLACQKPIGGCVN